MKKIIFISALAIIISSCGKDKIRGCTDPAAANFNSKADENDGSCFYRTYTVLYKFEKEGSGSFTVYYIQDGTTYTENNAPDGWTTSFTGKAGDYLSISCSPPLTGTSCAVYIYYAGVELDYASEIWPGMASA